MSEEAKRPSELAAPTGSAASEWPARDIVRKLIEAADLLLDHCDYDGDGWEEIHLARSLARSWAESPNATGSPTGAAKQEDATHD